MRRAVTCAAALALAAGPADGRRPVAAPDLAQPDLAMPDLAVPDLAMPDLAMPDLAQPDLATPDLAVPDLATPDLATVDFALPACANGVRDGNESGIDCGAACMALCP